MPSKLPSTTTDGLEWIEVADFTPGIAQIVSPNHPDGTATETNTYGCIAQAGGALVALPDQTETLELPGDAPYEAGATAASPTYIVGAFCNDPVFSLEGGNQTLGGPDQNNSELYIASYYWDTARQSQVNTITMSGGTGGTFTISVALMTNGVPGTAQTTSNLAYNASAATIDTALEALSNVGAGDVTCAGGAINAAPVTLTWGGALANQSIHVYVTWKGTLTGAGSNHYMTCAVTTGADYKVREVWRRTLNRSTPVDEEILSESDDTIWYASVRPRVCEFGVTRSNSGGPTVLGPVVLAFAFDGMVKMYPDDTAPASNAVVSVAGDGVALVLPAHLCLHQGRAVVFPLTLSQIGPQQVYTTTEGFYWSDVNDLTSLSSGLTGYFNVIVLPEYPVGYGVMESLTADELLLIKARGGGLILRGSLDDYSAKSLPNIKSTGQSLNRGTRSPIGFVYPVDAGGVWLWTGGDTSTDLTKGMEDEFWRPDYTLSASLYPYGPGYTSCAQWNEWVMLPNNWILDTSYGGYWRLEPVEAYIDAEDVTWGHTAFHNWTVDWKGRHAYGFYDRAMDANSIIGYQYDRLTPRSGFSWQSQPLATTIDRAVKARKFVLVASGSGTVTVTVTSNKTGDTDTLTFTIAPESGVVTDFPTAYMKNCHVTGSHIQVKIVTDAAQGAACPVIHGFRIGLDESAQLPVT